MRENSFILLGNSFILFLHGHIISVISFIVLGNYFILLKKKIRFIRKLFYFAFIWILCILVGMEEIILFLFYFILKNSE